MARILCIETSSDVCSVCLCENGSVIAILEQQEKNHASQLVPMIGRLFMEAQWPTSDLDAVAVSAGPGSFTGLRIGVASAKAICFAQETPLMAFSSLQLLAAGIAGENQAGDQIICPATDAGRNEIYFGLYDIAGNCLREDTAVALSDSLYEILHSYGSVLIGGSGAEKCENFFLESKFFYSKEIVPSSRFMAGLSRQAYGKKHFEDIASFEPFYLRPAYIKHAV